MEETTKSVTLGATKKEDSTEELSRRIAMQESAAQQKENKQANTPTPANKQNPDLPVEAFDDEFLVPTDEIELPSEGKFYSNGQKTIKIKYLTAEDENILTSPELIRNGKVLDVLLQNAIVDDTLNPSEMLTGDRNAVLLALRSTGYGDDYEVRMSCDNCGEPYDANVKLSDLISLTPQDLVRLTVVPFITQK